MKRRGYSKLVDDDDDDEEEEEEEEEEEDDEEEFKVDEYIGLDDYIDINVINLSKSVDTFIPGEGASGNMLNTQPQKEYMENTKKIYKMDNNKKNEEIKNGQNFIVPKTAKNFENDVLDIFDDDKEKNFFNDTQYSSDSDSGSTDSQPGIVESPPRRSVETPPRDYKKFEQEFKKGLQEGRGNTHNNYENRVKDIIEDIFNRGNLTREIPNYNALLNEHNNPERTKELAEDFIYFLLRKKIGRGDNEVEKALRNKDKMNPGKAYEYFMFKRKKFDR